MLYNTLYSHRYAEKPWPRHG